MEKTTRNVDRLIAERFAEIDAAMGFDQVLAHVNLYARIIASRVVDGRSPLPAEVEPYRHANAKLRAILEEWRADDSEPDYRTGDR